MAPSTPQEDLTWMKYVAHGAVIKNHNLAKVRLDLGKIFDVSPVAERAMLPIVSPGEVLPLNFQPINDGIGVLLY